MTQAIDTRPVSPEIVTLEARPVAVAPIAGPMAEFPSLLRGAFEVTMAQIAASGAQVAGPPFARYLGFGPRIEAEIGFPYLGTLAPTDPVREAVLPGGRAVVATYVGPYDGIGDAWERVRTWIHDQGLAEAGAPWESYLTGPDDPGQPVTQIVFPVGG